MVYSGGPFVSIGTITDLDESIGPINIPYSRLTDALDLILAETAEYNSYVPWEWWFDYTGALQVAQTRGTDKSASVTLEASIHIGRSTKSSSSRQTSQRVRTVGRGESVEQDQNTSDWWDNTTEMANVGTFYEKLDVEKELSDKDKADVWSQIILAQEAPLRQEITVVLENDSYTVNDFDVGDTVTVTDPDVNLSGKYRVKTIEKTVTNNGETTTVTLSNVRTDISDRLADFAKTLEKMQHSSTYIDVMYAEGSRQQQLNANEIEDIWEQTASNKFGVELPEDEADDPNLDSCQWEATNPTQKHVEFTCGKDEFEVWSSDVGAYGLVWLREPLVKFSRNPRFTCEFSINTTETNSGGTMTEWAYGDPPNEDDGDAIHIKISTRWGLCGGADPDNPNKYCCAPLAGYGFGFYIVRTVQGYMLKAHEVDDKDNATITIAKIVPDTKFTIEARMEWKEKVVKFYFGKTDVPSSDLEWGFRLRAILPISLDATDSDDLCPFWVEVVSFSGPKSLASKQALYIYRWKTQAVRAVKKKDV